MAGTRLTTAQCQAFAERTMRSLELLGAAEALERFHPHVDELVTDDLTGKPRRFACGILVPAHARPQNRIGISRRRSAMPIVLGSGAL